MHEVQAPPTIYGKFANFEAAMGCAAQTSREYPEQPISVVTEGAFIYVVDIVPELRRDTQRVLAMFFKGRVLPDYKSLPHIIQKRLRYAYLAGFDRLLYMVDKAVPTQIIPIYVNDTLDVNGMLTAYANRARLVHILPPAAYAHEYINL